MLTSERIADDLQAFEKSGGAIEVLGITQVLKKLGGTEAVADAPIAAPVRPGAGSRKSR
jgi:hypothetical protein